MRELPAEMRLYESHRERSFDSTSSGCSARRKSARGLQTGTEVRRRIVQPGVPHQGHGKEVGNCRLPEDHVAITNFSPVGEKTKLAVTLAANTRANIRPARGSRPRKERHTSCTQGLEPALPIATGPDCVSGRAASDGDGFPAQHRRVPKRNANRLRFGHAHARINVSREGSSSGLPQGLLDRIPSPRSEAPPRVPLATCGMDPGSDGKLPSRWPGSERWEMLGGQVRGACQRPRPRPTYPWPPPKLECQGLDSRT